MRRDPRAYLRDALAAVDRILEFTRGRSLDDGYPPDKQEKATQTVLEQAEALSEQWAAA